MAKGGRQPGAGRPKGTKSKKTVEKIMERDAVERFIYEKVSARLDAIMTAQMDLAEGLTMQEVQKDGSVKVYIKAPDKGAAELVFNRAYGKPRESVDVTVVNLDIDI